MANEPTPAPVPSPNETHIQAIVNAMKKAGIISGNIIGNNIATVINAITKRTSLSKTTSGNNLVVSGSAGYYPSAVSQTISGQAGGTYVPTTYSRTLASGGYYLSSNVTMTGDANLTSGNIRKGVSIFGVAGTYQGSSLYTGQCTINMRIAEDVCYFASCPDGVNIEAGVVNFGSGTFNVPINSVLAVSRNRNGAPPYYNSGVRLVDSSPSGSWPRVFIFVMASNGALIETS